MVGPAISNASSSLTLKEALKLSRQNASEVGELSATLNETYYQSQTFDQAYDPILYMEGSQTTDKTMSTNIALGDERKVDQSKIGFKKFFSTGTSIDLQVSYSKQKILYPEDQTTAAISAQQIEPYVETGTQVEFSQSLWNNFLAREVYLAKQSSFTHHLGIKYDKEILMQSVQFQTESLYWRWLSINNQYTYAEKLADISKQYVTLMKQRSQLGRADEIDVATAESQWINHQGLKLDLKIARDDIANQLQYFLGKSWQSIRLNGDLFQSQNTFRSLSSDKGLSNRLDLKKIDVINSNLNYSIELEEEKQKPTLDLFAVARTNGIGSQTDDSLEKTQENKYLSSSVGLRFSINLGDYGSDNQKRAYLAKRQSMQLQKQTASRKAENEVSIAKYNHDAAKQLIAQAQRIKSSLDKQIEAEKKRLRQARSDKIAILRYEMERQQAELKYIQAHERSRLAEARLKWALHAYERGL